MLSVLLTVIARADDWTVCDDALAPYATIQQAIDSGETIITICPGTYAAFELDGVTDVDIIGAGEAEVLVHASTAAAMRAVDSTFRMSGLTLTGYGHPGHGAAIDVHGSDATISNVTVRDCRSEGRTVLYGIAFAESDAVVDHLTVVNNWVNGPLLGAWDGSIVLRHSVFTGNRPHPYTRSYGTLLELQDDVAAEVTNNIFYGNTSARHTMALLSATTGLDMIVRNNIFAGYKNCGYSVAGEDAVVFSNNIIGHNDCLMSLRSSAMTYNLYWDNGGQGGEPELGDIGGYPGFVDRDAGDFSLLPFSIAIDAGDPALTDPDGSRSDIGAFGGPYGEW